MQKLLLKNWMFFQGDEATAFQTDFRDEEWEPVRLPHDWSVKSPFSVKNSSGTGYLPGGTAWYRCQFKVPANAPDGKVLVRFDGVYKNSQVWCNGTYLGKRPSGYAEFTYDITHALRKDGAANVLAVRVSHEDIADSRWFTGSGIYRKVQIEWYPSVCINPDETMFSTELTGQERAAIHIKTCIENHSGKSAKGQVVAELVDSNRCEAIKLSTPYTLEDTKCEKLELSGWMDNPDLWCIENPVLYTLRLTILPDSQQAEDREPEMELKVGIRSAVFDAAKGFFLNGESVKFKGVCLHHDAGCLGAAVYPEVWRRRLEKLKLGGCNAIRMSHNPHMPELYSLCDEMGFLVMEEAFDEWEGAKNKWSTGHNVYPPKHQGYAEDFSAWHEADLLSMVKRGRNHPSIVMWSVGNEVDYPNDPYCHPLFEEMTGNNDANKPAAERMYNPGKPNAERLAVIAKRLAGIVKSADTTRPVLIASAFPELSSRIGVFEPFDIMGYNYKEHLYQQDHQRFPSLPILGSENSHTDQAWFAVTDNEYISGQFLWTGIDFLGETVGWPQHGSSAGLLDMAGYPKTEWFRRRALWQDSAYAALAVRVLPQNCTEPPNSWQLGRVWNGAPGKAMQVVCYANLEQAELFCGGTSLGIQTKPEMGGFFLWEVPYLDQPLQVKASGKRGEAEDVLYPAQPASSIELREWKGQGMEKQYSNPYPEFRQIEVKLCDNQGRRCATEAVMLEVMVVGGQLLGIENGDLGDNTDYTLPYRRTVEGRMILYLLAEQNRLQVRVQPACFGRVLRPEIAPAEITLEL